MIRAERSMKSLTRAQNEASRSEDETKTIGKENKDSTPRANVNIVVWCKQPD